MSGLFLFRSGRERWLERPEQNIGCRNRFVNAEHLEDLDVGGIVHARDRLLDSEMALGHLQRDEVVLVISCHRDDRVGALDAGLREKPDLAAIASHHYAPKLSLEPIRTLRIPFDEGHLMSPLDEVAR
jgi:hypothetical protein